jgi:uncharacterized iron-regulated membrane protein
MSDTLKNLSLHRLIWRWHFYAGLFCIPFIIILSLTGSIYLFKPQFEAVMERPFNNLAFSGPASPLRSQIEKALLAVPNSQFQGLEVRQNTKDATRVILVQNDERIRVFVHPQTLTILKILPEDERFMSLIKTIHGELVMGQLGSLLVELAASWALVMIISGLYLWWPKGRLGLAGVLWPRLQLGSKIFWRDLHGVVGIYVSGFAIILLLTGLPWTTVWGAGFKSVRQAIETKPISQDWTSGLKAKDKEPISDPAHDHHHIEVRSGTVDLNGIEIMSERLRDLSLTPPVMLMAPSHKKPYWQGVSQTQNRPKALSLHMDPMMGDVLRREDFTDKKIIDQVIATGIAAHEGQLFGLLNQILGVLTALGLTTLCVSSVVMWWQRRAEGRLGAPEPIGRDRLGLGLGFIIITLCLFLPMMGLALISVALIERFILRKITPVRIWLGLRP